MRISDWSSDVCSSDLAASPCFQACLQQGQELAAEAAPTGAGTHAFAYQRQEESDMLTYALIVFAVAALGGLVLASSVLRGKLAPWAISILHALLGASGLVLLIVTVLQGQGAGRVTAALGILVVAALGGFYLASLHLRKQVAPKAVVFVHAGVAVVGFLTLLSAVLAI